MLLYFIICYKNRSTAETFNENPGEKYLFSLYLILIHDFMITFCVYLSLDGLICFFFFSWSFHSLQVLSCGVYRYCSFITFRTSGKFF